MEELMFRGGQRQVVDFLRAKFEAQNANLLETKVL